MLTSMGLPKNRFDNYFHSNSVLLQFILKDFFKASYESQNLIKIADKLKKSTSEQLLQKELEQYLDELSTHLKILAGNTIEETWQLPWHRRIGLITQLKNSTCIFAQRTHEDELLFNSIHALFHKMLIGCSQTTDLIKSYFFYKFAEEDNLQLNLIRNHLSMLLNNMRHISKLIMHTIYRYRRDENVIFFLVRNYSVWNRLYNQKLILKLISRMYPGGLSELKNFLIKRYTKRGFDFLIPSIKKSIADMRLSDE